MNEGNKKPKTILSRSLTGERRITVPRESGGSCEHKITEKKMAQQVKHCTNTQMLPLLPPHNGM